MCYFFIIQWTFFSVKMNTYRIKCVMINGDKNILLLFYYFLLSTSKKCPKMSKKWPQKHKKYEKFMVRHFFTFFKKKSIMLWKWKKWSFLPKSWPTFQFWTFINVQIAFSNPRFGKNLLLKVLVVFLYNFLLCIMLCILILYFC